MLLAWSRTFFAHLPAELFSFANETYFALAQYENVETERTPVEDKHPKYQKSFFSEPLLLLHFVWERALLFSSDMIEIFIIAPDGVLLILLLNFGR